MTGSGRALEAAMRQRTRGRPGGVSASMQQLVLLRIAAHRNSISGDAFPGLERLAEQCQCSVRSVREAVTALVEDGLLTRRKRGRGYAYRLPFVDATPADPAGIDAVTPADPAAIENATPADLSIDTGRIFHEHRQILPPNPEREPREGEDYRACAREAAAVVGGTRFASAPDAGGPKLNPWDERWIRHSKTALTLRALWNEILEPKGVPPWKGCPPDWVGLARLRAIELEDEGIEPDEAYWRRLIEHIAESEFLTGRRPGRDGRGFVFKPAWLLKAERFHEIRAHVFCDPGSCPKARQLEHRRVGA